MKKFLATVVAVIGAGICLWAGSALLVTKEQIFGFHPMYAGLVGIAVITAGLIARQD